MTDEAYNGHQGVTLYLEDDGPRHVHLSFSVRGVSLPLDEAARLARDLTAYVAERSTRDGD
jgi:hypothetical protein